jgi:hypothetical protein
MCCLQMAMFFVFRRMRIGQKGIVSDEDIHRLA